MEKLFLSLFHKVRWVNNDIHPTLHIYMQFLSLFHKVRWVNYEAVKDALADLELFLSLFHKVRWVNEKIPFQELEC